MTAHIIQGEKLHREKLQTKFQTMARWLWISILGKLMTSRIVWKQICKTIRLVHKHSTCDHISTSVFLCVTLIHYILLIALCN